MSGRAGSIGWVGFPLALAVLHWAPVWLIELVSPYPASQVVGNPVLLALWLCSGAVVALVAGAAAAIAVLVASRGAPSGRDGRQLVAGALVATASTGTILLSGVVHRGFDALGLTSGSALAAAAVVSASAAGLVARVTRSAAVRRGWIDGVWWVAAALGWIGTVAVELQLGPDDSRTWVVAPSAAALVGLAVAVSLGRPIGPRRLAAVAAATVAVTGLAVAGAEPGCRRSAPAASRSGPERRPDMVVLVVDTVRADHLGIEGYRRDTTPVLAALLADGATVFRNAVPAATATIPSVKGLFTSRSPSLGGLDRSREPPAEDDWTLARAFAEAGYQTAAFSANGAVHGGFRHGFDTFVSGCGYSYLFRSFVLRTLLSGDRVWEMYGRLDRWNLYQTRGGTVLRQAARWLDRRDPHRPVFLYLHLLEPHWPYRDHGYGLVPAELRELETTFSFVDLLQLDRGDPANAGFRGTPQLREMIARYDESLRRADHHLGSLLDILESRDLLRSGLLVVVGDHGEEFFDHLSYGHGFDVFEEQARVPLVVRWPDGWRDRGFPTEVEAPVSLLDIMPTCTELLGLPAPPGPIAGRSLVPVLSGSARTAGPVACESYPIGACVASYREGALKVRLRFDPRTGPVSTEAVQVFDLEADPGERSPLPDSRPEVAALVDRARRHFHPLWLSWAGAGERADPAAGAASDALERLRVLGYLD